VAGSLTLLRPLGWLLGRALGPGCPQAGGNLWGTQNGTQPLLSTNSNCQKWWRVPQDKSGGTPTQATPEQENVLAKSLGADIPRAGYQ